jgi:hypothetical protein
MRPSFAILDEICFAICLAVTLITIGAFNDADKVQAQSPGFEKCAAPSSTHNWRFFINPIEGAAYVGGYDGYWRMSLSTLESTCASASWTSVTTGLPQTGTTGAGYPDNRGYCRRLRLLRIRSSNCESVESCSYSSQRVFWRIRRRGRPL